MTMEKHEFIEQIAVFVKKYAPFYGIDVYSPIIAQAVLESAYGTSELAVNAHNYFGLKYREGRCKKCIGVYYKVGSEQNADGSYASSAMQWCEFENMEQGVIGYFDFINISKYSNLKGVTDPRQYLENIKADGYATSLKYVDNLMAVIETWNLTKYDKEDEFKMGNSSLVGYTKLSPNHSGPRTHTIDRITPHCVVGQFSAETICGLFINPAKKASCNYGIGTDGRISLCVEEENRSWCSSSSANDQRAVTIECASDKTAPYAMNESVYASLIELCVDICKRNGKKKLLWLGDKNKTLSYQPKGDEMVLTVHRWFANKSCPGDWLYSRLGDLANRVTKQLNGEITASTESSDTAKEYPAVPFVVKVLVNDLNYRSEPSMRGSSLGKTGVGKFTITEVSNGWGRLKSGVGWIWLGNPAYCVIEESGQEEKKDIPFVVRVEIKSLRIRKGPGTNYEFTGSYTGAGSFTIVEVQQGAGSDNGWGRLKSGLGWISLDFAKRI